MFPDVSASSREGLVLDDEDFYLGEDNLKRNMSPKFMIWAVNA